MRVKVPVVPASFFGMVIGLAGLGAFARRDIKAAARRRAWRARRLRLFLRRLEAGDLF